jgi:uncharacterized membrane protein
MNWAHVHLILNHIPVLGTVFGLTLLGWAILRRNDAVQRVALATFVAVALLALPVYLTGQPAEDVVEHAAGVSESVIEAHEEAAVVALIGVELLGLIAAGGLYLSRRGRAPFAAAPRTALLLSIVVAGLMAWTANLGGQIRHVETRAGAQVPTGDEDAGEGR